uniref:Conotoxin ar3d n=1 Tax=Conus araneosus TaxID=101286 RepID=M3D_CONAO|nr:RecName: Full=Conotoxin ar3d [Conus araneosus]
CCDRIACRFGCVPCCT